MWGGTDVQKSVRSIHTSLDAGVNFIDTAPAYGLGLSERIVGEAVRGRRDKVILATKCGLVWHTGKGTFFVDQNGARIHRYLGADSIRYEVEQSLRRLETDYIDLYQTHWQDSTTPIEETMGTLLDLKKQGKIRAIGVSNVSLGELKENIQCGALTSDQFRYSMLHREAEQDILPYCAQANIGTLTYMSLEQGLLTGKIGMDRQFAPEEFRSNSAWNNWLIPDNRRRVLNLLASWQDLTDKYHCTLSQLVIAWTAAQPGVTHVLAGARNLTQLSENAKAGELDLEPADLIRIRKDVMALGEPIKP